MLANLRRGPDRASALARYRVLAPRYDVNCRWLAEARAAAIEALALRAGETVFDVGCGTGAALPALAHAVGASGRVVGIEQSPEMAAIARERIRQARVTHRVTLVVEAVEEATFDTRADAMLLCYAHDVMQSDRALVRLSAAAKPGARIAVAGARFLPWLWAAPINLWTAVRARRYLTTYRGLRQPWAKLAPYCDEFKLRRSFHIGTSYLAVGTLRPTVAYDALGR